MDFKFNKGIDRSKQWDSLYKKLTKDRNPFSKKPLFLTIKELMYFCAALGYRLGYRSELNKTKDGPGLDDIQSHIFENDSNSSIIHLIGLAEIRKLDILRVERSGSLVEIFEEYANTGLKYLSENPAFDDEFGDQLIIKALKDMGVLDRSHIEEEVRADVEEIDSEEPVF